MKQIVVEFRHEASRVAILEEGRLAEFYMEQPADSEQVGNIYKGRIVNVLPGMQSAFVDIGLAKNAFLYVDDLLPPLMDRQPKDKQSISEIVRPGQELIVQVKKEPLGMKGARLTTHFTLPGRWSVFMPEAGYTAVSRKIASPEERLRLKQAGDRLRSAEEGVIIRTVAEGQDEAALAQDLQVQRSLWFSILSQAPERSAPCLLYRDLELIPRLVRDLCGGDVDEIVIDDRSTGSLLRELALKFAPELSERIRLYDGKAPIFDAFPVSEELERMFRRKIWLESGGYLVVDRTEALTVIDVNTGKYTGSIDLEHTVFETNMLAAKEIARIMRVRDLGGIILADFIDMKLEEHRNAVKKELEEAVKSDRTRVVALGWTRLGLFEITRKKVRRDHDQETLDAPK
jgi:ribonuclease G